MLRVVSAFSAKHRYSISRVKLSIERRARLRLENQTRWSSSLLMLDSFQTGYSKGIFSEEYPCPVNSVAIETYMQILLPAFQFNLAMQY